MDEIMNQLFGPRRVEAVFNLHVGGGHSWTGRVRTFDKQGRELSSRSCNEAEIHVHRTSSAAVKCAEKLARKIAR